MTEYIVGHALKVMCNFVLLTPVKFACAALFDGVLQ